MTLRQRMDTIPDPMIRRYSRGGDIEDLLSPDVDGIVLLHQPRDYAAKLIHLPPPESPRVFTPQSPRTQHEWVKEHKTQMGPWDPTEMITGWAREQGARRKLKAAETFRLMRLHES